MANLVKESEKQRSVIDNIMLSVASPFLTKRCSYCGLEIDNGEVMETPSNGEVHINCFGNSLNEMGGVE